MVCSPFHIDPTQVQHPGIRPAIPGLHMTSQELHQTEIARRSSMCLCRPRCLSKGRLMRLPMHVIVPEGSGGVTVVNPHPGRLS